MSTPPDIIFLLPDQLRHDFVGCYGADFLQTPAIDALAAAGTRYETCISPSPICVPARASMLTGQSTHAVGVMDNLHWPRPDRRAAGIDTWPEVLSDAGYHTAAVGKMHFYPWDISEGFAERIIAEDKRHIHIEDDYDAALKATGHRKLHGHDQRGYEEGRGASLNDLPDDLQVDRWVAARAVDVIAAAPEGRPLAMMVGFPGPHCPYDPPEAALARIDSARLPEARPATPESASHRDSFVASYKRPWADLDYSDLDANHIRQIRHHYAALVERLDEDVATIMAALERSGRLENAIVVFASDHGDYLGDFGLVGKTYFHEPSIRVPLIVADFRKQVAQVERRPVSLLDIYPSILDWAGLAVPRHAAGVPLTAGERPDVVVGATVHGVMARDAQWKLVRYRNGAEALYHLSEDPDEQENVIAAHPGERARLDAALLGGLLDGFDAAHADKHVAEAQSPAEHPFYRRGWQRPYPAAYP